MRLRLGLWLAMFLLTSCGFVLRGTLNKPLWLQNITIIVNDAEQGLGVVLTRQLQSLGVYVNPIARQANYLLVIEKSLHQQQITSVSASTTPRQYQLSYTVIFSLIKASGEPIISSSAITVSRQFTLNNNRILGSDFEGSLIEAEMQREAALQLYNRLGACSIEADSGGPSRRRSG